MFLSISYREMVYNMKTSILLAQNKILEKYIPEETGMLLLLSGNKKELAFLNRVDVINNMIFKLVYSGQYHRATKYLRVLEYECWMHKNGAKSLLIKKFIQIMKKERQILTEKLKKEFL